MTLALMFTRKADEIKADREMASRMSDRAVRLQWESEEVEAFQHMIRALELLFRQVREEMAEWDAQNA